MVRAFPSQRMRPGKLRSRVHQQLVRQRPLAGPKALILVLHLLRSAPVQCQSRTPQLPQQVQGLLSVVPEPGQLREHVHPHQPQSRLIIQAPFKHGRSLQVLHPSLSGPREEEADLEPLVEMPATGAREVFLIVRSLSRQVKLSMFMSGVVGPEAYFHQLVAGQTVDTRHKETVAGLPFGEVPVAAHLTSREVDRNWSALAAEAAAVAAAEPDSLVAPVVVDTVTRMPPLNGAAAAITSTSTVRTLLAHRNRIRVAVVDATVVELSRAFMVMVPVVETALA